MGEQETEADRVLKTLSGELAELCVSAEAFARLAHTLPDRFPTTSLTIASIGTWSSCAHYLRLTGRWQEALGLYLQLYEHLHSAQAGQKLWHKGDTLVWISDCFFVLGYAVHAKRYLMLTLCEDAIHGQGTVDPNKTGVYWRLVGQHGLSEDKLRAYATKAYQLSQAHPLEHFYPEAVLQRLDDEWLTELPTPVEAGSYRINRHYVDYLRGALGRGRGEALEQLAEYLMASMPGCRTRRRLRSGSTDYDVVCGVEGAELDFRSEFGRYFVCECKDWKSKANFTTIAKFCRVLDSTKSRFGILFSRKGISGVRRRADAALEQLKVFQDRGIVIVVLDEDDLAEVAGGKSLIALLRTRYEEVRLNLSGRTTRRKR